MEIEELGRPYAGEQFQFIVTGGTSPTRIEAYINGREILSTDCPDPPCHEFIFIPLLTAGAQLWIIAQDVLGNTVEKRFTIGNSETSAGGSMSAEG